MDIKNSLEALDCLIDYTEKLYPVFKNADYASKIGKVKLAIAFWGIIKNKELKAKLDLALDGKELILDEIKDIDFSEIIELGEFLEKKFKHEG